MGIGSSTVVYGVGFEEWTPSPASRGVVWLDAFPAPSPRRASDADLVAEVCRRMLKGTLSPRCRALLEDALKRCED